MILQLLKNNCMFGASSAVDREAIKESKSDIIARDRAGSAMKLGLMISAVKGWHMEAIGNLARSRIDLFVLTHEEMAELLARARSNQPIWDEEIKVNE